MTITKKEINRNILTNRSTELSEDLAKGRIDPREVLREVNSALEDPSITRDQKDYLSEIKRQLVFREFARSAIEQQTYRQPPGAKPDDSPEFKELKAGETGIPVIDAAVREMQATGKPHNRARLLLARYAIRNLNQDPEDVADWLGGSFADYDPVLTTFNVTSAASGATFGEPYFRKSNPLTAAKSLDPKNEYTQKWLPDDYSPKQMAEALDEIQAGHEYWIKRWKDAKPVQDLPTKRLYPTRDEVKGIYFVKDSLPARGSFSPYYRKFKENESELIKKAFIAALSGS